MKKIIYVLMIIAAVFCTSCADPKTIDGRTYDTYGLLNQHEVRSDSIHYQVSPGSLVVGIIFCETVIAPIYIFGFALYEPVAKKSSMYQN